MPLTERGIFFMGSSEDYAASRFVIIGAPMDFTVSFRPGSRSGPQFIRLVSSGLEEYSIYQDKDLAEVKFYDKGDLVLPFGNVKESLECIEEAASEIFNQGKFPLFLGGEHLVSLPIIKAAVKKFSDLAVFHFDAHADLRPDYLGQVESHATVMRYVSQLIGDKNLYQFGIRSGTREEMEYAEKHTNMYLDQVIEPLERVVENWDGRPVYVTIDIDVVDPAYAPGTGTPEPGGCTAREIVKAVHLLKKVPVIGMDIVEVSPLLDQSQRTALLAAKLVREALLGFSS